jgi:hypothetical protein
MAVIKHTSNNIPYETKGNLMQVFLVPITGRHNIEEVNKAKDELESRYIHYNVSIQWQRDSLTQQKSPYKS